MHFTPVLALALSALAFARPQVTDNDDLDRQLTDTADDFLRAWGPSGELDGHEAYSVCFRQFCESEWCFGIKVDGDRHQKWNNDDFWTGRRKLENQISKPHEAAQKFTVPIREHVEIYFAPATAVAHRDPSGSYTYGWMWSQKVQCFGGGKGS